MISLLPDSPQRPSTGGGGGVKDTKVQVDPNEINYDMLKMNNVKRSKQLFSGTQSECVALGHSALNRLNTMRSKTTSQIAEQVKIIDDLTVASLNRMSNKDKKSIKRDLNPKGGLKLPDGVPTAAWITYNRKLTSSDEDGEVLKVSDDDSTASDLAIDLNLKKLSEAGMYNADEVSQIKAANHKIREITRAPPFVHDSLIKILTSMLPPVVDHFTQLNDATSDRVINMIIEKAKIRDSLPLPDNVIELVINGEMTTEGRLIDNFSSAVTYIEDMLSQHVNVTLEEANQIINRTVQESVFNNGGFSPLFKEVSMMNLMLANRFNPLKLYGLFKLPLSDGATQIFTEWDKTRRSLNASEVLELVEKYYFNDVNKLMLKPFSDPQLAKIIDRSTSVEDVRTMMQRMGKITEADAAMLDELIRDMTIKEQP